MASTKLTRTQSTGNRTTFTWSGWVKRSITGGTQNLVKCGTSNDFRTMIRFDNSNEIRFFNNDSTGTGVNMDIITNRQFRDINAWYHIVLRFDTTQATASDRIRFYVNGVQETSLGTSTYPSQNADNTQFNYNGITLAIGGNPYSNIEYFDGSMSHIHFCDGYSYDATAFGQYDANGVWTIKTSPSVTYGTNGFFILKDGNSVTDQSGEGNNFTVGGGTLTNTEDCPSNVFATLNPLDGVISLGNSTFTYGNTRFNSETASNVTYATSTLGMVLGKFYFEAKLETAASHNYIGISDRPNPSLSGSYFGDDAYTYGYKSSNGQKKNNGSSSAYGDTYTTNDIVMCAVDLDNLKVYFGKNGTWQNSGDPTSGSTGTGAAFTITTPSSTTYGQYFFCVADGTDANNSRWQTNFGNGYFGTTAVSDAGINASGIGIFEFDVPTGYTSLSTKGLNL